MKITQEIQVIGTTHCFELEIQGTLDNNYVAIQASEIHQICILSGVPVTSSIFELPFQSRLYLILNNMQSYEGILPKEILLLNENQCASEQIFFILNQVILINAGILQEEADKLIDQAEQIAITQADQILFKYLIQKGRYQSLHKKRQYEDSISVLEKMINDLKSLENTLFFQFNCYIYLSEELRLLNKKQEALEQLRLAREIIELGFKSTQEQMLYTCIADLNEANIKQDLQQFSEVSDILLKALANLEDKSLLESFPKQINFLTSQVLNNLSTCRHSQGKLEEALKLSLNALQIYQGEDSESKQRKSSEIAKNLANIASLYRDVGNPDEALEYALKAKDMFEQVGDVSNLSVCYGVVAAIYQDLEDTTMAKKLLQQSVDLHQKNKQENTVEYAITLAGLGRVMIEETQYDQALDILKQSLDISRKLKLLEIELACLEHISDAYQQQNDVDNAIDYLFDAIKIKEELQGYNQSEELLLNYMNMVVLWEEKGDADESQYYTKKAQNLEKVIAGN